MTQVMTTKMSSRGQVVIPEAMRNRFGWGIGTSFTVEVYRGNVIMQPIRPTPQTEFARRFDALLTKSRSGAKAAGMRPCDITDAVAQHRASRRRKKAEK